MSELEEAESSTEVKGRKPPLILLSDSVFQILKAEIDKVGEINFWYIFYNCFRMNTATN